MNILFGIYYTMDDPDSQGVFLELQRHASRVSVFARYGVRDEGRDRGAEDAEQYVLDVLARRVTASGIDVVLARGLHGYFREEAQASEFRARVAPCRLVELSEYYPYQLHEAIKGDMRSIAVQSQFDLVLCGCHASVERLREYGVNAAYYPSPAQRSLWDIPASMAVPRLSCDVLMPFGSCYRATTHPTDSDRVMLPNAFLDAGLTNLRIYGGSRDPALNPWLQADPELAPWMRPETPCADMRRVMRSAKVGINTSVIGDDAATPPRGYWSDRLPSLLLAGTMALTDNPISVTTPWTVGDTTVQMEDGVHLATFGTIDEAVEQARYYLTHDEERQRIAQTGHDFAVAHLTETEAIGVIAMGAIKALLA